MLTNGARASRLVISNGTTGMDSNKSNFDCQARELINKFEPRPDGVKGITHNIIGLELDEVGKQGGGTRRVRMGEECETPEPRARRNARSDSDRTRVLVAGVCLAPPRVRKVWQMTPPYV